MVGQKLDSNSIALAQIPIYSTFMAVVFGLEYREMWQQRQRWACARCW